MTRRSLRLGLLALFGLAGPLGAQEMGRVEVHGYGTWAYGRTGNPNQYVFGTRGGAYDNVDFAVNLGASLAERVRVNAQLWGREGGASGEEQTKIDFIYADLHLTEQVHLRVGDVKQPFGLYAEVFDLGTVRPFLALPQSVYGGAGFVGESYKGVCLTGELVRGPWGLSYDVYGGGLSVEEAESGIEFLEGGAEEEAAEGEQVERTKDMIGGRLVVRTPMSGLSFGASAYNGSPAVQVAEGEAAPPRSSVVGAQVEYLTRSLMLRGEAAHKSRQEAGGSPMHILGGYAEAAYRLGSHWQLAGQYDRQYTDLMDEDVSAAPSLLQHTAVAGGLNYWVSSNLVLKGSYHVVKGNRFAAPAEDLAEVVESRGLERRTSVLMLGAQMSF